MLIFNFFNIYLHICCIQLYTLILLLMYNFLCLYKKKYNVYNDFCIYFIYRN